MGKFKNKYRSTSTRLKHWDYSKCGWYFITICTKNQQHFFGEIINHEMILSTIGKIVDKEWNNTPKIRPDMNIILNEYIIMPNHFHGIIIIGKTSVETHCYVSSPNKSISHIDTPLNPNKEAQSIARLHDGIPNKFGPQKKIYHQ